MAYAMAELCLFVYLCVHYYVEVMKGFCFIEASFQISLQEALKS
jgi:hypothetical protein